MRRVRNEKYEQGVWVQRFRVQGFGSFGRRVLKKFSVEDSGISDLLLLTALTDAVHAMHPFTEIPKKGSSPPRLAAQLIPS